MNGPAALGPENLAVAAALVLLSIALTRAFHLGLTRHYLWASLRALVQLLLVGYVLRYILDARSPWLVLLAFGIMLAAAVWTAVGRGGRRVPGLLSATTAALALGAGATTIAVTAFVVRAVPWWSPRYSLPLAGMIIGNAMNAAALTAERLQAEVRLRRDEIEELLALGATARQAIEGALRASLRSALIPTINSMLVVGVVSLPGMMTGQIIAGADPIGAARYQIVVVFMLSASTAIAAVLLGALVYRRFFTEALQLRQDLASS